VADTLQAIQAIQAIQAEGHIERHAFFEAASDETIEKALARLRAARSLGNFPTLEQAQILASQVEQSRYSSGSPGRSRGAHGS